LIRLAPNYTYWTSLEPIWSPSGNQVVFVNPNGGLLISGSGVRAETTQILTSVQCESPAWSPNGRQIVCIVTDHNLALVEVGTRVVTQLTTGGDSFTPTWVRNGQTIAFFRAAGTGLQRYEVYDLYVLDLLTGEERRLAANLAILPPLTSSPDGTLLAYPNASHSGMIVLNIHTGVQDDILASSCLDTITNPAWSPDGRFLAFAAEVHGSIGDGQIYLYDVQNHQVFQLTHFLEEVDAIFLGTPTWSPDSTALALDMPKPGDPSLSYIVIAPLDPSQLIPVGCP
jgi:Tol biopolymer transport system component